MFNLKKISLLAFYSLAILSLSACDGIIDLSDEDDDGDQGYYRFVNLSAQNTTIAIEVDETVLANVDFSESSTVTSVDKGTYDLVFNQVLPNSENSSFISDSEISVSSNTIHSYILYGASDSPEALEIETDVNTLFDEDFDEDYGLVQFVNVADSKEDYDVYIVDAGDDLLNATAESTLAYLEQSADIELDSGYYKIIITEPGTDTIVVASDNITIRAGEAFLYTIVSYQVATSDNKRMAIIQLDADSGRMLTNDAQPAYLRFNHGISDNYLVDIFVDSGDERISLVTNLAFGELSAEISLSIDDVEDGDSRDFYIVDSDTEETIDTFTLEIDADSQLDILTAGLESTTIRINDVEEDLRTIDSHAKIIFSHAIDDEREDSLEFLLVEDGANPDSYSAQTTLSYLTSGSYEIEQGDYVIYVYNENSGELLLQENLYGLSAGEVVNLTATESEYGGKPYALHDVFNTSSIN